MMMVTLFRAVNAMRIIARGLLKVSGSLLPRDVLFLVESDRCEGAIVGRAPAARGKVCAQQYDMFCLTYWYR